MKVRVLTALICCVASIGLVACGGDDETNSTTAATGATGAADSSDASIEDRMRAVLAQGGVTGTQADCVIDGLNSALSADQLQEAADTFDSTGENTPEFEEALGTVAGGCDLEADAP
jgi:hypothetical protein